MTFHLPMSPLLIMVVVAVFGLWQANVAATEAADSPEVVATQSAVTVEVSSDYESQTEGVCNKDIEASKATKQADGKKATKDEKFFLMLLQILGSPK